MPRISQASLPHQPREERQNPTRISPFGWVMLVLLLVLGAINFADKAVLGLAAVPIINELHLSPAQYGLVSSSLFWLFALSSVLVTSWADMVGTKKILGLLATTWAIVQLATVFVFSFPALLLTRVVLGAGEGPSYGTSVTAASKWLPPDRRAFGLSVVTFGSSIGPAVFAPVLTFVIVMVGWRMAFASLGIVGALWVIIWLLVARERPADVGSPVYETHVARRRTNWTQVLPILFSRNIIFIILAAFSVYWGTALSLSWTPVYLVTVLHLKLTSPLYIAGVSLPWIVQGLTLFVFGALADRAFRRTGSAPRSRVLPAGALVILGAVFLYLAINIPSTLGAVTFFILAATAGAAIPLLGAIVLDVAPQAHRGFFQGRSAWRQALSLPDIFFHGQGEVAFPPNPLNGMGLHATCYERLYIFTIQRTSCDPTASHSRAQPQSYSSPRYDQRHRGSDRQLCRWPPRSLRPGRFPRTVCRRGSRTDSG